MMRQSEASYLRRERAVVFTYIFCLMVALAREIHRRWNDLELIWNRLPPPPPSPPKLYAPDAYRPGMTVFLDAARKLFHIHSFSLSVAISDFFFGLATLLFLYFVAVHGYGISAEERPRRSLVAIAALAFLHFPLLWTLDWMRYNTLPCGFYLALSLWMLQRVQIYKGWMYALAGLAILQSFVRSEVSFLFGFGILLLGGIGFLKDFGSRKRMAVLGLVIAGIAGMVQLYMQFVVHPHLTYQPGVKAWMLPTNLQRPYMTAFAVAMLPAVAVYVGAWFRRKQLRSIDWLCLVVPVLDLPLWLTVASAMEVRVFVPFFLMLAPVAAHVVDWLLSAGSIVGAGAAREA